MSTLNTLFYTNRVFFLFTSLIIVNCVLLTNTKIMNKKTIPILLLLIALSGCGIKKTAIKSKVDRTLKEQTESITKRKGDTVTYTIPKIVLRDTTIYTVNRQGTTLKTSYNSQGQISQIDCFASMIEEITRSNRELVEAIKDKDTTKEENFNPQNFIYSLAVLGIIVLAGFIYINSKITKL